MTSTNVLRDFSSHLTFRSCVTCDTEPVCNCAASETCIESSRTCTECPTTSCVPAASTSTPAPSSSDSGSNTGAIAGGVVGGLAFIAIIVFLIWWFVIRKRRQAQAAQAAQAAENSIHHERSRSMQSIASTVLTRASNVIQIAYIPGVTNRSSPETPGTLVPPVPAIPSTHASTYSGDQYLFTPRDLRDSRYTATSDRRSIATSLARSSVATTIYRHDAIVNPVPAQQVRAARAAVVSVKTGNNTPSDSLSTVDAPAVPAITEAQLQKAGKMKPQLSSIVARSVVARPVNVKAPGSKPKVPTVSEEEEAHSDDSESVASHSRAKQLDNQNSTFEDSSDDDSDAEVNEKGKSNAENNIQIALSSPSNESPFADSHTAGTPRVTVSTATSVAPSPATEAVSTSRASMDSNNGSSHRQRTSIGSTRMLENAIGHDAATQRSSSPFDDQHEIK